MSESSSSTETILYHYDPSLAAAVVASALFLISSIIHFWQLLRTRTWYLIPLLLGGFCEWIGYIARTISSREAPDFSLGPYIVQSVLLLIAPVLFAASIYMELSHIIVLVDGGAHSPIRRRFLTSFFVLGDILAFLVQSTGASVSTKKKPNAKKSGQYIIIGGLVIQLLFFGLFMIVSAIFHRRISRKPTHLSASPKIPWLKHLIILYATSLLVMVRSVFRTVEYVQGSDGYLISREIWLYIFDGVLMFLVMVLFNVIHPSEVKALIKGRRTTRWIILSKKLKKASEIVPPPTYQGSLPKESDGFELNNNV